MSRASKNWDLHVEHAEEVARSAGFRALRDRIIELAVLCGGEVVVDVGSGTGLLSLAAARSAKAVWAIDSSRAMGEYLEAKAQSGGLLNIRPVHASAASLPLMDGVADVVVSNYCYHELRDEDKRRALTEAFRVLKPGGRVVIGDMMFSLKVGQARDRKVMFDKVVTIGKRGLPGAWRLLKNSVRLASGRWEHPANADWWREALMLCGFEHPRVETFPHEGGIAAASKPQTAAASKPQAAAASKPQTAAASEPQAAAASGGRGESRRSEPGPQPPSCAATPLRASNKR